MPARSLFAAALASLALVACEEKSAPPPAPTAPAQAPVKRDFGGGYHGTKWGMSPAEVEKVLGAPAEKGAAPGEPDLQREVFHIKDDAGADTKKEIDAYFVDGKLLRAVFIPHFTDDFVQGYEETRRALAAKYGPGAHINGQRDPRTGALVDLVAWNDGTTVIQLRVDRMPADQAAAQKKADPHLYSTTQIIYTGVQLATDRERRLAQGATDGGAAAPAGAPDAGH